MSETVELLALLQRHYIKPGADLPGGVFVPEVGQNGRWGAGNRCDAIYVGFTSTSGRILIGHELKTSRADWLAELNKPGKADTWADECHEWWLVVANPDIVGAGELPPGWGLMIPGPSRTRMQVRAKAHRKDPGLHRPSWDAVRGIMARQDTLRAQAITERIKAVRAKISAESNQIVAQRVDAEIARRTKHQPDTDELARRLAAIEEALGAAIDWAAHDRGHPSAARGKISLSEIQLMADAVRAAGSVQRAVQNLTAGWANPVDHTQAALDELASALTELGATQQIQEIRRGA
ncbi:hypothetical protein [Mycobacterium intracellulare]|uniref:MmcB family DNA repair protein n=1 Tax=Mycobacterium intracellulare subsp. chimaera TaxID=222805 RepID=A0A7U5MRE3_MYCIT|nr:hypothetical protein [Mycobacterium intracellulare]ASL18312.1 hypothetical protein MYCOZU2_05967 [Mycobacterium intracellulare subsp. chimaera]